MPEDYLNEPNLYTASGRDAAQARRRRASRMFDYPKKKIKIK
jgi:hypothetical protein